MIQTYTYLYKIRNIIRMQRYFLVPFYQQKKTTSTIIAGVDSTEYVA